MASEREARIEAVCAAFHDAMLSLDHSWGLPDDLKMLGGEGEKHAAIRKVWLDAVALMRTAPSAAPASVGRAIEELECVLDYGVAEQLADYIQDRIAALRAEPSPEPQRAGAGLVEAVTELIGWLKRVFDGPAHRSAHINNQLGRQSIEPVIHALAAEQAREPDDRDEEVSALRGHVQHQRDRADLAVQRADALQTELRIEKVYAGEQRKRAEKAESAYKEAAADRQIAQDALWAYREQVEPLRERAKAWADRYGTENDAQNVKRWTAFGIVRDLAALPTEPEGQAAKADAGGVAVLRRLQADLASSEMTARANGRECRDNSFGKVACDASADAFGTALDMVVSLLAEAESQPESQPERPTCEVCTERPAVHVAAKAGYMFLCDECHEEMPTETFSEDEPEREGDDVLREFQATLTRASLSGDTPWLDKIDAAVRVLAKRALEGR